MFILIIPLVKAVIISCQISHFATYFGKILHILCFHKIDKIV